MKSIYLISFALLTIAFTCCEQPEVKKPANLKTFEKVVTAKPDYQRVFEFLTKLRNSEVDTILFYDRTCISCCDFYNVFWVAHGQQFLTKFYSDTSDLDFLTITLQNDSVFEFLKNNFIELKRSPVKPNTHVRRDGSARLTMIDHYCHTDLFVYTRNDSISVDIEDHQFDKYTDYGKIFLSENEPRERNDNYAYNLNSKWNGLLMIIERKLSKMKETSFREIETLRMNKKER